MDCVIALREISVTAPCYSSILFRREQENPSSRCEGTWIQRPKRRVPHRAGESEQEPFGSSFYVFPSPWACPVQIGLARSAVLPEVLTLVLGPSFDLPCSIFMGFSLPCLLATAILDSFSLF